MPETAPQEVDTAPHATRIQRCFKGHLSRRRMRGIKVAQERHLVVPAPRDWPTLQDTTGGHDLLPVRRLCGGAPQHLLPIPTDNQQVVAGFGVVSSYEGSYGNTGRWHGQGTIQFQPPPFEEDRATPAAYTGDFVNGDMHGTGVFTWRDGTEYHGEIRANKIRGKGTLRWPHGNGESFNSYEGDVWDGQCLACRS